MSALQASIDRTTKRPARSAARATATKGTSLKVSAHREKKGRRP